MKTLLLFILMLIPPATPFNPEQLIGKSETEFESYCKNIGETPRYGYLNNKGFIRLDLENKIIICIYKFEIEAFRIYYSKDHYNIEDIELSLKKHLFVIKPGFYISITNPQILYNLNNSEDNKYFCLFIYAHGME